jgi:hypothetical protein
MEAAFSDSAKRITPSDSDTRQWADSRIGCNLFVRSHDQNSQFSKTTIQKNIFMENKISQA